MSGEQYVIAGVDSFFSGLAAGGIACTGAAFCPLSSDSVCFLACVAMSPEPIALSTRSSGIPLLARSYSLYAFNATVPESGFWGIGLHLIETSRRLAFSATVRRLIRTECYQARRADSDSRTQFQNDHYASCA